MGEFLQDAGAALAERQDSVLQLEAEVRPSSCYSLDLFCGCWTSSVTTQLEGIETQHKFC